LLAGPERPFSRNFCVDLRGVLFGFFDSRKCELETASIIEKDEFMDKLDILIKITISEGN